MAKAHSAILTLSLFLHQIHSCTAPFIPSSTYVSFASLCSSFIFPSAFANKDVKHFQRYARRYNMHSHVYVCLQKNVCQHSSQKVGLCIFSVCMRVFWSFHTWAPPNSECYCGAGWQGYLVKCFSSLWLMACWKLLLMKMRSPLPTRISALSAATDMLSV